jgi:hypothetical protein
MDQAFSLSNQRFEFLFFEAFSGLLEQKLVVESDELRIKNAALGVYVDTGDVSKDYKVLRDAIDAEIDRRHMPVSSM